ncbi:MAG: hypothetical protein J0I65_20390 [Variovorax sp.]|uniref:Uncharacterized protein n=1 Tax=Variovorax paradoxus TaxID=34073 RepID=A0A2W5QLS2_VARPD|nr:hypothetical protein [Variovorax sp.]PZQ77894.1 MAG: hypothetical protein DI563_02320 [Variovorax paradoxus]
MNALREARRKMQSSPDSEGSRTLSRLVIALESGEAFPLEELYALDFNEFELAINVMKEWRLDRHYAKKLKLFDVSTQVNCLGDS